jgi:hypothetical protein
MKKIITALAAALLSAGYAFAADIEMTREIKTGLFVQQREIEGNITEQARLRNNDGDSGDGEGRIRLGVNIGLENFGMRTRFYRREFTPDKPDFWVDFAYAYVDAFDSRLRVAAGILGESPWGTGGPELFRELETGTQNNSLLGIRTEWKPRFLPGLDLGFVLNRDNDPVPNSAREKFGDIFEESIVGIAYENKYFAFRFAYRFNRAVFDSNNSPGTTTGARFVYRVEERLLGTLLPGMQIWANGYSNGILEAQGQGSTDPWIEHWLYIVYDPENFTAGLNIRYKDTVTVSTDSQYLEFRPSFYYKFFNNLLSAGVGAGLELGYNNGRAFPDGAFYNFWFIEPQVRVNVSGNIYAAIVYRYTVGQLSGTTDMVFTEDQKTQWLNIRLCFTL